MLIKMFMLYEKNQLLRKSYVPLKELQKPHYKDLEIKK